jgi:GNAT superfamily N-acetyltransferase
MHVTIYHLEMTDPAQLVRPSRAVAGLVLREVEPLDAGLIQRFYLSVGERFHWVDRRPWTLEQWREWAEGAALTTLVAAVKGTEAGFAVLDVQSGGEVELEYFGLLGDFIGRGYGGAFLYETTRRAWALGARRVRLHTCTLDHPSALPGYQARGFRVFRVVEEDRDDDGTVRG